MPVTTKQRVLLIFRHGLGDAVQFTSVLRHLRRVHPEWHITVAVLRGKDSAVRPWADEVLVLEEGEPTGQWDRTIDLQWPECGQCFVDSPSTKVELTLRAVFGIKPDPDLWRYRLVVGDDADAAALDYLRQIGAQELDHLRFKAVAIHYQGNTSPQTKNLDHWPIWMVCEAALGRGWTPVILDWDRRSPLPDQRRIFCPGVENPLWLGYGTGDAERIAALIRRCGLVVAIDSGPQKVALALDTPTLCVWTYHHPIHYACPAPTAVHLVPSTHRQYIRGGVDAGLAFFAEHYRHQTYADLAQDLPAAVLAQIDRSESLEPTDWAVLRGVHCRRRFLHQDAVIVKDVIADDCYRLAEITPHLRAARLVVDVGAHLGSFAVLVRRFAPNAKIVCIEACPDNIEGLRRTVGDWAEVIHGACTYQNGELMLFNSMRGAICRSTGGSTVTEGNSPDAARLQADEQYRAENAPRRITLEEIAAKHGPIDVLKLDCEGSEYGILARSQAAKRARVIVGEWHDSVLRWHHLVYEHYRDWGLDEWRCSPTIGTFRLIRPEDVGQVSQPAPQPQKP